MAKYRVRVIWEREDEGDGIGSYIDHTNLSPIATPEDIKKLCEEAMQYGFKAVCVNPSYVKYCKELLKDSGVLICTVVGFPLGQNTDLSKIYETVCAVNDGADEIDMVINIADLKARNSHKIIHEVNDVVKASGDRTVKVIVETCLLNDEDKEYAMKVLTLTRASFIKTSTGFSTAGADVEDVKKWNEWRSKHFSPLQIKAAGGIRNHKDFIEFIRNGADRIGTSKGVDIILNTRDDPAYFDSNKSELKNIFNSKIEAKNKKIIEDNKIFVSNDSPFDSESATVEIIQETATIIPPEDEQHGLPKKRKGLENVNVGTPATNASTTTRINLSQIKNRAKQSQPKLK